MTRLNERILDSVQFKRRKATEDTKRKIGGWEIWYCEGPEFQHCYDRTVSLYVHQGAAVLTFDGGETVDLRPGDLLAIEEGARAASAISEPIRNSYMNHDTFTSALAGLVLTELKYGHILPTMATTTIKSTYSLDVETVRTLEAIARRWNVSKSEALRRAIRGAADREPPEETGALEALDLDAESAGRWEKQSRAERKASSKRLES